jgi:hypothetical protein
MLQAILFYSGDTSDLIKEDEAMNNNGDDNMEKEKKKDKIKIELLQKKKGLPTIEPEASINERKGISASFTPTPARLRPVPTRPKPGGSLRNTVKPLCWFRG